MSIKKHVQLLKLLNIGGIYFPQPRHNFMLVEEVTKYVLV